MSKERDFGQMLREKAPHVLSSVSENLKFLNGKRISIDIDAVTQATFILALRKASHDLGRPILKEELTDYWKLAEIARDSGISEHEALDFAKNAWNRHEVYQDSPAMPGAKTLLRIFKEIGVPYISMSSRPVEFKKTTDEWFEEEIPWVKSKDIILGREEGMFGGDFKALSVDEFNVGLHIEDAIEEAMAVAEKTDAYVLVVPQPWNIGEEGRKINHPRIKHLGDYFGLAGTWPVLRFLVSKEAAEFFPKA